MSTQKVSARLRTNYCIIPLSDSSVESHSRVIFPRFRSSVMPLYRRVVAGSSGGRLEARVRRFVPGFSAIEGPTAISKVGIGQAKFRGSGRGEGLNLFVPLFPHSTSSLDALFTRYLRVTVFALFVPLYMLYLLYLYKENQKE